MRAAKVVRATGAAGAASYEEAASLADVIILAVPWKAVEETLPSLGKLTGKVVVDITVPYGKEIEALGTRSSGEVVQKKLRGARVVKGWNHVFAKFLTDPKVAGVKSSVLLAGDDAPAKKAVSKNRSRHGFPSRGRRGTTTEPSSRPVGEHDALCETGTLEPWGIVCSCGERP